MADLNGVAAWTNPNVGSVSAFFPCYNDASTIARMVADAGRALERCVADFELIVVDDGSRDDSAAVLSDLSSRMPKLRVVTHPHNKGYGAALISGFGAATKEWIFYTDGDGQYEASDLDDLVRAVADDIDVVQGWKIERADAWYRTITGEVFG